MACVAWRPQRMTASCCLQRPPTSALMGAKRSRAGEGGEWEEDEEAQENIWMDYFPQLASFSPILQPIQHDHTCSLSALPTAA